MCFFLYFASLNDNFITTLLINSFVKPLKQLNVCSRRVLDEYWQPKTRRWFVIERLCVRLVFAFTILFFMLSTLCCRHTSIIRVSCPFVHVWVNEWVWSGARALFVVYVDRSGEANQYNWNCRHLVSDNHDSIVESFRGQRNCDNSAMKWYSGWHFN